MVRVIFGQMPPFSSAHSALLASIWYHGLRTKFEALLCLRTGE
jgi:hypothetical protein